MGTVIKRPKVVSSGQGVTFNILGHTVTTKLHSWDDNGNYIFEMISPPGSGIPPHVHDLEDEVIYILEGEFDVMIGGESYKARTGDCLNFSRNIPHSYTNTALTDAKTLWFVSPGSSFEEFFTELSQYPPGPPDMDKLNILCKKYGMKFLI
ncbi:MAG TPA: cupin domain-containing protein [Chitinophagaceae bacterium]|nr:cupin domain-containing protein [Chitinophagaceae bacterium]